MRTLIEWCSRGRQQPDKPYVCFCMSSCIVWPKWNMTDTGCTSCWQNDRVAHSCYCAHSLYRRCRWVLPARSAPGRKTIPVILPEGGKLTHGCKVCCCTVPARQSPAAVKPEWQQIGGGNPGVPDCSSEAATVKHDVPQVFVVYTLQQYWLKGRSTCGST